MSLVILATRSHGVSEGGHCDQRGGIVIPPLLKINYNPPCIVVLNVCKLLPVRFQDGATFSTSTEDTARIQNDGVAPDNVYFDDEGSGIAPDESSGSGWGAGPGPDDEDGRAGSGDAPDGDSDDEDFARPTKAPATETPRLMPDESSVSVVPAIPDTEDNYLNSLMPDTDSSPDTSVPDTSVPETEHPIPPPDQTFEVEIPRILKPSEGAVDTSAGGAREEAPSRPESDISISGEDLNPDIVSIESNTMNKCLYYITVISN
ncbi:unnamed protein product [Chilo suppressalis]|uniref:Uncharacterized protein n=1 Tax=Chilo suppressalis TaxID=168631 RepID=A0ABN8LG79_CHISP|nr:unnamed protein product [Chilo suppressalis]